MRRNARFAVWYTIAAVFLQMLSISAAEATRNELANSTLSQLYGNDTEDAHIASSSRLAIFNLPIIKNIKNTAASIMKNVVYGIPLVGPLAQSGIAKIQSISSNVWKVVGYAKYAVLYILSVNGTRIRKAEAKMIYAIFNVVSSGLRMALRATGFHCINIPRIVHDIDAMMFSGSVRVEPGSLCGLSNLYPINNVTINRISEMDYDITIPFEVNNLSFASVMEASLMTHSFTGVKFEVVLAQISLAAVINVSNKQPLFGVRLRLVDISGLETETVLGGQHIPMVDKAIKWVIPKIKTTFIDQFDTYFSKLNGLMSSVAG